MTTSQITTAEQLITSAEQANLWPVEIKDAQVFLGVAGVPEGSTSLAHVPAPQYAGLAGVYADGSLRCLGVNGSRYNATSPEQWRDLVRAAIAAGAQPLNAGKGATAWGAKVSAELHCGTTGQGLDAHLCLTDSFDGSCRLSVTPRIIRRICTNTLRGYARAAGEAVTADFERGLRRVRHTASLNELIKQLEAGIPLVLQEAQFLDDLLRRASSVHLPAAAAQIAFDRLFKTAEQAAKDAGKDPAKVTPKAQTQAENRRAAARIACELECNKMGGPGNLGSLWMGATYLVDRTETGEERRLKGGANKTEGMLFGGRGQRVEEIREFIQVVLQDGRIEEMTVAGALQAGAVDGAAILRSMLS